MSLHPPPLTAVPLDTARVARAVFLQGNLYLRLRDELGAIYEDEAFAPLFSERGQPVEAPWRLALVTIMQYVEGLSVVMGWTAPPHITASYWARMATPLQ